MLCRDILLHTSRLLNLKDVEAELLRETEEYSDDFLKLQRCMNLVLSEIVEEYIPLKATQAFEVLNGKILYSDFEKTPIKIFSIKDADGYNIKFSKMHNGIALNKKFATVTYSYCLDPLTSADSVDIELISIRTIAYGIIAEYYMLSNRYEEAAMYSKRFKGSLRNISYDASERVLKMRRLF